MATGDWPWSWTEQNMPNLNSVEEVFTQNMDKIINEVFQLGEVINTPVPMPENSTYFTHELYNYSVDDLYADNFTLKDIESFGSGSDLYATITFDSMNSDGQIIINTNEGTVELTNGMTVDEGAAAFWDAVQYMGMGRITEQANKIEELEKKIAYLEGKNRFLEDFIVDFETTNSIKDDNEDFERAMSLLD